MTLVAAACLAVVPAVPLAGETPVHEAVARGRTLMADLQTTLDIPGASLAVARDGEVVWSEGFGLADREQGVAVTADTRFRLGGLSKLLTVAAMGRLMDAGRLDPDVPVQRYVSSVPAALGAITSRQLAGHRGGIRHYRHEDFTGPLPLGTRHFDTVEESLELFVHDELVSVPGTAYGYSDFGYTLLSAALEGASGLSFPALLEARVLRPLALNSIVPDDPRALVAGRGRFYDRDDEGGLQNAAYRNPSYNWAGSGLLGTAEDMARFALAHVQPGFLSEGTRRAVFTPQGEEEGTSTGVGLGWQLGQDARGRALFFHAGGQAGCRAVLLIYPNEGVVVSLLTNLTQTPFLGLETAQALAGRFLPGEAAGQGPRGTLSVEGLYNGRPVAGTLELTEAPGRVTGMLALGERRWPVLDLVVRESGIDLALLHPQAGLLPLSLEFEGSTLRGTLQAAQHELSLVVSEAPNEEETDS